MTAHLTLPSLAFRLEKDGDKAGSDLVRAAHAVCIAAGRVSKRPDVETFFLDRALERYEAIVKGKSRE